MIDTMIIIYSSCGFVVGVFTTSCFVYMCSSRKIPERGTSSSTSDIYIECEPNGVETPVSCNSPPPFVRKNKPPSLTIPPYYGVEILSQQNTRVPPLYKQTHETIIASKAARDIYICELIAEYMCLYKCDDDDISIRARYNQFASPNDIKTFKDCIKQQKLFVPNKKRKLSD